MKIASERKIVAIVVAVFVAFTTITHGVAVRSPQRVLKEGTVVKTQLTMKGVADSPELVGTTMYFVIGGIFGFMGGYYAYNGIQPGGDATATQGEAYFVVRGPPLTNNPPPSTLDLVQELP